MMRDSHYRQTTSRPWRPALYTFGAVFLSILVVGAITVPSILGFAEDVYLDLLSDSNERQTRAMIRFLRSRLDAGVVPEGVAREFQKAIEGSHTDRGYVCLIEQQEVRYVSHPNLELLGMEVKPGAIFDPALAGIDKGPWRSFIQQGTTAEGHLSFGPQMAQEMIYFTTVPGTDWTISTHENISRIEAELATLRRRLVAGSVLLALLLAVPASLAARAVSKRYELQIVRQAELERRLLEEEDARKAEELNEARKLQLSLLPKELPRLSTVQMAAHMETATEVGGDYYDVLEAEDGAVTLAIGDATGHGLQAGTVVTAVKSLFTYCAEDSDLVGAVRAMARALRRMRLGRLSMAFAVGRLQGRKLELVGAGMPPALVYRAATGRVEHVALDGVPLGSPLDFPYRKEELELSPGDTVLLMSDGLPELGSARHDPLGYEGAERVFRQAAADGGDPKAVIDSLLETVSSWSRGRLEDDVTLFVLRATS